MKNDPDKTLDAIAESMQTFGIEGLMTESIDGMKKRIVDRLLQDFRGDTLTNEKLWAGIGAIDEFDRMQTRLDRAIRVGRSVSQQLMEE